MMTFDEFSNNLINKIDRKDICYTLLFALKHKYYRVYMHSIRVAYSSYYLAKQLDLADMECEIIALGALFHDVGKMNISPKVLYKAGPLDDIQWLSIRRHQQYGINLLNLSRYIKLFKDIILYHHERYDVRSAIAPYKSRVTPLE